MQDIEIGLSKLGSVVVEKDCHIQQLCKDDALDHRKWIKLIKILYSNHKYRM